MKIFGKKEIITISVVLLILLGMSALNNKSYALSKNVPSITSFVKSTTEDNALKISINNNNSGTDYSIEILNLTTGQQNNLAGSSTNYTYQNLTNGKEYQVMARVCTNNSNEYSCTPWSEVKKQIAGTKGEATTSNTTQKTTPSKISITEATITNVSEKYRFLAKAVTPVPKVTVSGKTLKSGTDYTVSYKNHKEPGVATVTVTGKGNYTGSKSRNYTIYIGDTTSIKKKKSKITLSGRTYTIYSQSYSGSWSGGKIRTTGCGPRATAIIISGYGYKLNTKQVAQNSTKYNRKYRKAIDGSKSARGKGNMYYMQSLGFSTKCYSTKNMSTSEMENTIKTALKKGHQLWYQVGPGSLHFTSRSHNIALLSIDTKGTSVYTSDKGWKNIHKVAQNRLKGKRILIEVWKPLP